MHYVSRLEADSRLKGKRASNTPHYYNCDNGIYDGIAACLETIADNSRLPSFRESLEDAAEQLRRTDPAQENLEKLPNVIQALVYLIGALMEVHSEPSPDA
jgi:hypothetical protein